MNDGVAIDRAIILAGGTGSRLMPRSGGANKHLVTIHDAPMIHFPLALAIGAGIRHILVVTTPAAEGDFRVLLGDGSQWGISLEVATQRRPNGIAGALAVGESFAGGEPFLAILGDNILDGECGLADALVRFEGGAELFAFPFEDPRAYAVAAFGADGAVLSLEEKPAVPRDTWAVGGIYLYDATAFERIGDLIPSEREELEITDLNRTYLADGALRIVRVGGHVFWNDAGTPGSFDRAVEHVAMARARGDQELGNPRAAAIAAGFLEEAD